MAVSNSDTVILPDAAIPLSDFQNAYSRLTLVLCPSRTTDRFTIRDFIFGLVLNSGFIPVVGMAGKETGSTDDAWERATRSAAIATLNLCASTSQPKNPAGRLSTYKEIFISSLTPRWGS